jgi:hypothetical protein
MGKGVCIRIWVSTSLCVLHSEISLSPSCVSLLTCMPTCMPHTMAHVLRRPSGQGLRACPTVFCHCSRAPRPRTTCTACSQELQAFSLSIQLSRSPSPLCPCKDTLLVLLAALCGTFHVMRALSLALCPSADTRFVPLCPALCSTFHILRVVFLACRRLGESFPRSTVGSLLSDVVLGARPVRMWECATLVPHT